MNPLKLILLVAVGGVAYHYWDRSQHATQAPASTASAESRNGFVPLPPVAGANPGAVLVIAADNCPEEAAQRADRLAEQLARDGVRVSRLHNVSFEIPNADPSVANQVMSVMNGELPIVVVNGRARANPTLAEVTAEYKAAGL